MSAPPDFSPPPPPPAIFRPEMGKIVRPKAGKVFVKDTGSMRASGLVGDQWVDMETPRMEDIREGDLIVYEHPARGGVMGHQVKRVRKAANGETYFQCAGTSNHGVMDAINVDKSNFVGRFTIPKPAHQFEPPR